MSVFIVVSPSIVLKVAHPGQRLKGDCKSIRLRTLSAYMSSFLLNQIPTTAQDQLALELLVNLGLSPRLNPNYYENRWYALWDFLLHDLVQGFDANDDPGTLFCVTCQFAVWATSPSRVSRSASPEPPELSEGDLSEGSAGYMLLSNHLLVTESTFSGRPDSEHQY